MSNEQSRLQNSHRPSAQIHFSREGKYYSQEISQMLQSKTLGLSILELAWTAGPLTFIALQLGYFVGFGQLASMNLVIYFVSYTLIAGLVGIIVRVYFQKRNEGRANEAQKNYLRVIDQLVEAGFLCQDSQLLETDPDQQKYVAAQLLLSDTFITPNGFQAVLYDLVDNKQFCLEANKILIYQQAGMAYYAKSLLEKMHNQFATEFYRLEQEAPQTYELILEQLSGSSPTLQNGAERPFGFLERIFSAVRSNDSSLFSTNDAKAFFNLSLEMLAGRSYPYYTFSFSGSDTLLTEFDNLEKNRQELLITLSAYYSRINALADILFDNIGLIDKSSSKEEITKLMQCIVTEIDNVILEVKTIIKKPASFSAQRRQARLLIYKAEFLLKLYKKSCAQNLKLKRKIAQFEKISKKWYRIKSQANRKKVSNYSISLQEKRIQINDEKLLELAQKIIECINENKYFTQIKHLKNYQYHTKYLKHFTMSLATIFDETLNLSQPPIQNAIQETHAPQLNHIGSKTSASYRLGLIKALCSEIKTDMRNAAIAMVKIIMNVYEVELSPEAQEFLEEEYDIESDTLASLSKTVEAEPDFTDEIMHNYVQIPLPKKSWETAIAKAKAVLKVR